MRHSFYLALLAATLASVLRAQQIPDRVPPRCSCQLADGFGMNIDLPREPHMPWTARWWSRIFDSGVKWVRIGQYENSSEKTSWDWVEQTPGRYEVSPDVDEAIRALADNCVEIEIELQYSNPLYQGDAATRPKRVLLPPPGIGPDDEPPNPIFIPPTTDEQIEAFLKYVRYMVGRYRRLVRHWELWNEPDIGYWHPQVRTNEERLAKAQQYAKLLCRFADAVHETDPQAKVMSAGLAGPDSLFARAALSACPSKIDVVAYHTYPGFGSNHAPEEADALNQAAVFREQIMHIPGIRNDVEFWLNEWNVSPKWRNSNESVQAHYVPRFYLYSLAQGVKPFMWTFVPSTDGNEDDLYGILHGDTGGADSFQPRQAYRSFSVVSALFGQTVVDPLAEFAIEGLPPQYQHGQLQSYAFKDSLSGKRVYAYWLAVLSDPSQRFVPVEADLRVHDAALQHPVLIDVLTGAVQALEWKDRKAQTLRVPVKNSVVAVADRTYLDWLELPGTPSGLRVSVEESKPHLRWIQYDQQSRTEVQRSVNFGPWEAAGQVSGGVSEFVDHLAIPGSGRVTYRVGSVGVRGASAWSNPAWVEVKR